MKYISITKEMSDYFVYDETSKSCLRRKSDGKELGSLDIDHRHNKYKRWRVSIPKVGLVLAHRIVWVIHNNEIPINTEIDHIDGNALNNNIINLRLANRQIATKNLSMRSDNKTGVTGVKYRNDENVSEMYTALWKEKGSTKSKSFSVLRYGKETAFRLACEYRKKMIEKLNANGEQYSETHGSLRNNPTTN